MKFYYVNHKGERLNLSEYPYIMTDCDFLNWTYSYDGEELDEENENMKEQEFKCTLAVVGINGNSIEEKKSKWKQAIDRINNVIAADVINKVDGKLHSDKGSYKECRIVASEKRDYIKNSNLIHVGLKIVTKSPYWIEEVKKSYSKEASLDENSLDYSYNYPYDYSPKISKGGIDNNGVALADFELMIYGPVVNPSVTIGENVYQVFTEIKEGEYLKIDTRNKTVEQYDIKGESLNKYNSRNKEHRIFNKISVGSNSVYWNGDFGFDVVMFKKRSEPQWNL